MPSLSYDFEREQRLAAARTELVAACLTVAAERYKISPAYGIAQETMDAMDAAAKEYVELLNTPEVCQACGQEVPCGVDRAQERS
jgi:predicted NAD-dependent protein-ADP-ribosyltransferase YbiA (DUF1768 family)